MYLIDSSATRFLPCFAHWARAERDLFRTTQPPPLEQEQQSRGWQSWWSERQCECLSVRVSVWRQHPSAISSLRDGRQSDTVTWSSRQCYSSLVSLCWFSSVLSSVRCTSSSSSPPSRHLRHLDCRLIDPSALSSTQVPLLTFLLYVLHWLLFFNYSQIINLLACSVFHSHIESIILCF